MTLIALDDEPLALKLIERYVTDIPEWRLLASFTDAAAAAAYLQENAVDLLLTDIHMPDTTGLQFVRELPDERPIVIFVTAYKEYAHEGFDLEVADYLVKPVSPARFRRALDKAAELIRLRQAAETLQKRASGDDHFYVFSDYLQVKIVVEDILYIESMGDYVRIHLNLQARPVVTLERMKTLAARLEPQGFSRIHRSYLVNKARIGARQKSRVLVGDVWLPVGRRYGGEDA